eukprot:TRINITY_DN88652_c0_g1_i1.p1 TRINITY_DN88652_c0_g1~~TRINITY_DN88652_c0_g1_i1.p1  ORF type:complete len:442 (-),score=107.77 TRINITY_DN88652_c0_g1_i1:30-1301(-)
MMRNVSIDAFCRDSGLSLDSAALEALGKLPEEQALELLESVAQKVSSGHIKNPSNYVCATIARGYVSEAQGGATAFKAAREHGSGGNASNGSHYGAAQSWHETSEMELANQLSGTVGMMKAQQAGLQLNEEAAQALLKLPTDHASQLLEQTAERLDSLRDPSNYIMATIAKGFQPWRESGLPGQPPPPATPPPASVFAAASWSSQKGGGDWSRKGGAGGDWSPRGGGGDWSQKGGAGGKGAGGELVPHDITQVERFVLDLNSQDLWQGQRLDANTLLALRCVSLDQGMELLSSLQAKGMGKGSVSVQNPNNYLQAAVSKILRGDCTPAGGASKGANKGSSSMNFTGNQTRQKAAELGLVVEDISMEALARLPLRASLAILDSAAGAQMLGEDVDDFIFKEAAAQEPSVMSLKGPPRKRGRWEQ